MPFRYCALDMDSRARYISMGVLLLRKVRWRSPFILPFFRWVRYFCSYMCIYSSEFQDSRPGNTRKQNSAIIFIVMSSKLTSVKFVFNNDDVSQERKKLEFLWASRQLSQILLEGGLKRKASSSGANTLDYDAKTPQLTVTAPSGTFVFRVFDRVMVAVSVDESNIQRPKISMRLTTPAVFAW